jgi:hypothetical protein
MDAGYRRDIQEDPKQKRTTMSEHVDSAATLPQGIPDELQVPEGQVLLLWAYDKGVQIYTCPLIEPPRATPNTILLTGDRDEDDLVAIHFAGPSWQATDGSIVVGDAANAKHLVAPDPDDLDWLLLPAKSTSSNGLFSKVTYNQRLFTDGGKATLAGCQ